MTPRATPATRRRTADASAVRSDGTRAAQRRARAGAAAPRRAAAPPAAETLAAPAARSPQPSASSSTARRCVASASEPIDRQVIELVTRLFDSLLADSQLPAPFRPVVARMQVAGAARRACAEHAALDSLRASGLAPARPHRRDQPRLLAHRGSAPVGASSPSPPPSPRRWPAPRAPDTALFRRGLNRIDVFLVRAAAGPAARRARRRSRRCSSPSGARSSQQHLAQRLTDQMVAVRTSPTIRRFVTGTWARVIADDMLRHGEQSEADAERR